MTNFQNFRKCTFGKPDKLLWDKLRDLRYLHLFITSPGISSRWFLDRSTCCKFNKLPINSSISSIFTSDIDKSLRSSKLPMIGNIRELVYNYFWIDSKVQGVNIRRPYFHQLFNNSFFSKFPWVWLIGKFSFHGFSETFKACKVFESG